MAEPDKWSRWLAETRFGGDQKAAEIQLRGLTMLRKRLLKKAGLAEGKVVLDVGAGEGLIGFGALDLVGATGRVIFSDISSDWSNSLAPQPNRWECSIDARS